MPTPTATSSYPQFFWDIELLLISEGPKFPALRLDTGTHGKAVHLRQRFYAWRQLRLSAPSLGPGHSTSALVLNHLRVRLELPSTLIFEHIDDDPQIEAQLQAQGFGVRPPSTLMDLVETPASERGEVVAPEAPEPKSTSEEQEAVLRKLGFI